MPKQFDKMVSAIKAQLMADDDTLTDEEATQKAFAIATSEWKKKHGGKAPESIKGEHIVAENVKVILDANILATNSTY